MNIKAFLGIAALVLSAAMPLGAKDGTIDLKSPDGSLCVSVSVGTGISYTVSKDGAQLIAPSSIAMTLSDGVVFGEGDKVRRVRRTSKDEVLPAIAYRRSEVRDNYNEMTLVFKEFTLIFRAYDEGLAYRFKSSLKKETKVLGELAEFNFDKDWTAYVPYANADYRSIESQYTCSFENTYAVHPISGWQEGRIAFMPVAVAADNGVKVLVTEADLTDYPGMFLRPNEGKTGVRGEFAPVPDTYKIGGHNMLQKVVTSRKDYIAEAAAGETFPWRVLIVSSNDAQLAVNDMVWKLATPQNPEIDFSWVKPGKVAWDWWNNWNVYGVDFVSGINNDTYKYYIDFAAAHGIEYVILDEGWAVNLKADLMQVVPEIDLPMLCKYASERGVGLILWAGYYAFDRDMENVCRHYAEMGVKGFKVDFMDSDNQETVRFYWRASEMTAKYHMLIDFHGAYKPTGLSRTWPNVINYEGVHGLEQMKWDSADTDQVTYDVTVPYIRMAAGSMDYTQGAMRNASKGNYAPCGSEPMSQGTRCHQLAEYVIFDSPLNMLCDSPSNYMKEEECTAFIAACPTVWDESVPVNGEMGKYISLARRSGDVWYLGSLNNWDSRDLELSLDFLPEGEWTMDVFRDGVNAHRAGRDYKHQSVTVQGGGSVNVHLAPGGGWVARITRVK